MLVGWVPAFICQQYLFGEARDRLRSKCLFQIEESLFTNYVIWQLINEPSLRVTHKFTKIWPNVLIRVLSKIML